VLDTTSFAILPTQEKIESEPKLHVGSVKSFSWKDYMLTGTNEHGEFLIYFVEKKIPRILINPFGKVESASSIAVSLKQVPHEALFEETNDQLMITCDSVKVEVTKDPFTIKISNNQRTIFQSGNPSAFYKNSGEVFFDALMETDDVFYGFGDLQGIIQKLDYLKELGVDVDSVDLIRKLLVEFEKVYDDFKNGGFPEILNEWRRFSKTIGSYVEIRKQLGEIVRGEAVGVNSEGALILELDNGKLRKIVSGECIHLGR